MIQDPQQLPQELLFFSPKDMMEIPPISASKTHCLFDVESSGKTGGSLVSTTLCLYDETWPFENPGKRKKSTDDPKISCGPRGNTSTEEKRVLSRMRLLSNEEREEEEMYGVSTELTLSTDPWTIKKELTISDLSHVNRLLLNASTVHSHILRYLPKFYQKMVQEGWGLTVDVYDHDTDSKHQMLLKKRTKRLYYVLSGGWLMDFVCRRALKNEDEIGMFWDRFDKKLHFRVLSRAPIGVSSDSVTMDTLLADPSQAPIGVGSDFVTMDTLLADPSQGPIGVSSGSVTIASYPALLEDP